MLIRLDDTVQAAHVHGGDQVQQLIALSQPCTPQAHLFETEYGSHLLMANGSRIYTIGPAMAEQVQRLQEIPQYLDSYLTGLGLESAPYITDEPLPSASVRALSLAIAQKCNLGCAYCYAQEGQFGGAPKNMPLDVAKASVSLLLRNTEPGDRVQLAFLGGEPLVNRNVLRATTEFAAEAAEAKGVSIGFSLTTNGTLLRPEDGSFFEAYGFAVTVSLDGVGTTHDRLRPYKSGRGSYSQIIRNVQPLLALQHWMQVSARVTVTPSNLCLRETLDELIALGFHSVGFSPMLTSPTGRGEMRQEDLHAMLEQMVACGEEFERQVLADQRYPFQNMGNAMKEIHRGTHRPYPCGAGAGYFGVSAEGGLFACHRFVDDVSGTMGNLRDGVDAERQHRWLAERHVHRQEPCRSCWARYLCGGGCHHEVMRRGRPACDYIRGWLHYCLQAYIRLLERKPAFFGMPVAIATAQAESLPPSWP
jgi:uncharacterized protein